MGGVSHAPIETECPMNPQQLDALKRLFTGREQVFSLLRWPDPASHAIEARSFVINGHDSVPLFASEAEGRAQLAGSGFETELVGIEPGLLAAILQQSEYAILNPGGQQPLLFRTSLVKPYAKLPG